MPSGTSTLVKRVNFVLSGKAHSDLAKLARDTNRSMTDVLRLGLGLAKLALEAERADHRLIVASADGQPLREIVLPPS